jgi:hypothetical protein
MSDCDRIEVHDAQRGKSYNQKQKTKIKREGGRWKES